LIGGHCRVVGDLFGKTAQIIVAVNVAMALFGICLAQIVASAADAYYYTEHIDKRCGL
jgi:hypothetical protein